MKKIVYLFILISNFGLSQKVHVVYDHVRSPIATLKEDLYIDGSQVLSVQDSIVNFSRPMGTGSGEIHVMTTGGQSKKVTPYYFISKLQKDDTRDFFFTGTVSNAKFLVADKVPIPEWEIIEGKTNKILGYPCKKAIGKFRGTKLIAYFTEDLPYSTGPYKFYGLPGLILDIREEGMPYHIWKASKIEVDYKENVNMSPAFSTIENVTMKEYVIMKEEAFNILRGGNKRYLPPGTTVKTNTRVGIDKVFEWEDK